MTTLGAVFLLITLWCLVSSRRDLTTALALAMPFASSAAVNAGGNSVQPFYVIALVALAVLAVNPLGRDARSRETPGRSALLWFVAWSVLVTAVAPTLFHGIAVLAPRGGIDNQVLDPSELGYTISNVAQVVYLLLGASVVAYVARSRHASPTTLTAPFAVATTLSFLRYFLGSSLSGLYAVIDNSTNVRYIDSTPEGVHRLRGVFAEPSALAAFSIAALAYFMASLPRAQKGTTKTGYLALIGMCLVNLYGSQAGVSVASGALVLAVAVAIWLHRALSGSTAAWPLATIAVLLGTAALIDDAGGITSRITSIVSGKVASTSYFSRTTADFFSLKLARDTWGIGVGLGSNRPSSMWPMLLSCVGVVGVVLLLVALRRIALPAWRDESWRPTAWALLAVVLCKSVTGSDLSSPELWFPLALCAARAWRPRPDATLAAPVEREPIRTLR